LALLRFRRLALLRRRAAFRRLAIRRAGLRWLMLRVAVSMLLAAIALLHPLQVTILLRPAIGLLARLLAALPSVSRAALLRTHEPSSS
jgi:hypothetical protein